MPTVLSFDECSGLIATQRACASDSRAEMARRGWLIERTARELMRGDAFAAADDYVCRLFTLEIDARERLGGDDSVTKSLKRRAHRLGAEIEAACDADLAKRFAALTGGAATP